MMVPVMVTTVEIVKCRLSSAPMNRTRPSCFGFAQPRCQAQDLRCRLVRHVVHQAPSELVHVRVQQLGVRRFLRPS